MGSINGWYEELVVGGTNYMAHKLEGFHQVGSMCGRWEGIHQVGSMCGRSEGIHQGGKYV